MGFGSEEIRAGEELYRKEIFHLYPVLGMYTQAFIEWREGNSQVKNRDKIIEKEIEPGWNGFEKRFRYSHIEYEFLTNIARYYDICIKCERGREKTGERYLMNKLAVNIDTIKRMCGLVGNEVVNPCNFDYHGISVKEGCLENEYRAFPVIRAKLLPRLLGSSGKTAEVFEAYEYGVALGLATGLPYEWIYTLVDAAFIETFYIEKGIERK